jgi:hydroxyacylglutathione hydrolase
MIRVEPIRGDHKRANIYIVGNDASGEAILIDPGHSRSKMVDVLVANRWKLKAIFLTRGGLEFAARAAEAKQRFQVPLYTHSSEVVYLQRLPALADRAGMCGVKVPQVDQFLHGEHIKQCGEMSVQVSEFKSEKSSSVILNIEGTFFVGGLFDDKGKGTREESSKALEMIRAKASQGTKIYASSGFPFDVGQLST